MSEIQAEKRFQLLDQLEVNYTPVSVVTGDACSACRWFRSYSSSCQIVEGYPEPIEPNGWCDRFERVPEPVEILLVEEALVELTETVQDFVGFGERVRKVTDAIKSALPNKKHKANIEKGVFKALGDGVWIAAYSNNFIDREDEIISQKAHDGFIDRVDKGLVDPPELWFWHVKGTRHGYAETVGRAGHIIYAIGRFDDSEAGREAEKHYKSAGDYAYELSHGFVYPDWAFKDGVYDAINTFEISTIPIEQNAAANPWTAFNIKEGMNMPPTDVKIDFIKNTFGKAAPSILETIQNQEENGKAIAEQKVTYKDFVDTLDDKPESDKSSDKSSDLDVQYVEVIAESQLEMSNQVVELTNLITGALKAAKEQSDELKAVKAQLEAATKAVQVDLEQTPTGVDDTTSNAVDDAEAQKLIEKQQGGKQFDPRYLAVGLEVEIKPNQNGGQ